MMASDAEGNRIGNLYGTGDHTPARWCASGALAKFDVSPDEAVQLNQLARSLFPDSVRATGTVGSLVWVNDELGHEAVMQVFEKALVELEGSL
jgi:hypothetical protein